MTDHDLYERLKLACPGSLRTCDDGSTTWKHPLRFGARGEILSDPLHVLGWRDIMMVVASASYTDHESEIVPKGFALVLYVKDGCPTFGWMLTWGLRWLSP